MATVYDIVRGINQAAANAYDGSHKARFTTNEKDDPIGLKREEGCPIKDSRVMDGFKVKMAGPILIVSYQSEMPIKSFHNTKLGDEMEAVFRDIVKYLKKEYQNINNEALSLTPVGPCDILLQNMSKVRTFITCQKNYRIGNMKDTTPIGERSEDRIEDNFKNFLAQSSDKKSPNDTRPNE
jgi:hypothetical protein|tara:strand:+ start:163 stop:705 length:543 start_codon:yes stop_codon:yes gene_type:complete